jgi:hypothetical protein
MTSFDELVKSAIRVSYQEKVESAWTAMIAAQGDKKTMTRYLDPLVKFARRVDPRAAPQDGQAFQKMLSGLRYRKRKPQPSSPLKPGADAP